MKIYLIGYRCTGKTTIGKILANMLNYDFMDIDKEIELETKSSIVSIVNNSGWDSFRKFEKEFLIKTCNSEDVVISTGGGIVIDRENRELLKKNGISIWLFADINVILNRLYNDQNTSLSRPNLTSENIEDETRLLIEKRDPLYSEITKIKYDTSVKTAENIAQNIKRRITNDRE